MKGSFDDPESFHRLAEQVRELDECFGTGGNHAFYLSIPPKWFGPVCENLAASGRASHSIYAPENLSARGVPKLP